MPSPIINPQSYQKLLTLIRKEISSGEKIILNQKVLTYWKVGRHISKDILKNKDRAGYGQHLYESLEKDIKIKADTLSRAVQFFREYPILGTYPKLSWNHYQNLLTIDNSDLRNILEKKAIQENLSVRDLQEVIKHKKSKVSQKPTTLDIVPQLSIKRGLLNTYQIIRVPDAIQKTDFSLAVDCGFHWIYPLDKSHLSLFQNEQIVESVVKGSGYQIKKSVRKLENLYTYKAYLIRVVDGDTIWVYVDCGFKRFSHQKLRFRGIDVPEINTTEGKKAKVFIESIFRSCPFVVIKTYKSDKYDRPLVDVFYLEGQTDSARVAAEGRYLNQELLDARLARVWKD